MRRLFLPRGSDRCRTSHEAHEVIALDVRALVSEIRQLLEGISWKPNDEHLKLSRYDHGGGRLFRDGPSGERQLIADFYHEADREFYNAAPRLLTAALGLIEQQQEEIRKSTEIIRASNVVPCAEHGDLPRPATS
jgi:hypothetical protein